MGLRRVSLTWINLIPAGISMYILHIKRRMKLIIRYQTLVMFTNFIAHFTVRIIASVSKFIQVSKKGQGQYAVISSAYNLASES